MITKLAASFWRVHHQMSLLCTPGRNSGGMTVSIGSHRRLDLATQFMAMDLAIIGLQETRIRKPRAKDIAKHAVFASAATSRGQGGLEIWIRKDWLPSAGKSLILHADHRLLIVATTTKTDYSTLWPHMLLTSRMRHLTF
jgi:hypothetical protein